MDGTEAIGVKVYVENIEANCNVNFVSTLSVIYKFDILLLISTKKKTNSVFEHWTVLQLVSMNLPLPQTVLQKNTKQYLTEHRSLIIEVAQRY